LPAEAAALLTLALKQNPQLAAAQYAWTAEVQRARATDGFFDPRLAAAAGLHRGPAAAPESGLWPRMADDAASVQGGLLLPLRLGVRVGVGVSQRHLFAADGFEDLAQSVAGVRLEAPLARDRGFRLQRLAGAAARAVADGAAEGLGALRRAVMRDTIVAYAAWLQAAADLRAAEQAALRVERLRDETAARVALRTTPEYQLFPARMEVALRHEELRAAQAALSGAGHRLTRLVGAAPLLPASDPALLRRWATRCATGSVQRAAAAGVRPELRQAELDCVAAEHLAATAREGTRSDLSLVAGAGFSSEDVADGPGGGELLSDRQSGVEVALVWSRPFSFAAEEAALQARLAEVGVARAEWRRRRLQIEEEQALAETALDAVRDRLGLVDAAILEARRALAAEEERLRLGEGRSRNVLDAQKDLTAAERRANAASFETVRAFAELLYATGAPLAPGEEDHVDLDPAI
jgi:outer membrane protein TolC